MGAVVLWKGTGLGKEGGAGDEDGVEGPGVGDLLRVVGGLVLGPGGGEGGGGGGGGVGDGEEGGGEGEEGEGLEVGGGHDGCCCGEWVDGDGFL